MNTDAKWKWQTLGVVALIFFAVMFTRALTAREYREFGKRVTRDSLETMTPMSKFRRCVTVSTDSRIEIVRGTRTVCVGSLQGGDRVIVTPLDTEPWGL